MSSDGESDPGHETPRKRQRLSSPTYDQQFVMSQEEVDAFDVFNRRLSQTRVSPLKLSAPLSSQINRKRSHAVAEALGFKRNNSTDSEPVHPTVKEQLVPTFTKASDLPTTASRVGFTPASRVPAEDNPFFSSSPNDPPHNDSDTRFESTDIPPGGLTFKSAKELAMAAPYEDFCHPDDNDDWLTAAPPPGAALGFQSAKSLPPQPDLEGELPTFQATPVTAGFTSASTLRGPESHTAPTGDENHSDKQQVTPAYVGFQTGSSLLSAGNGSKKTSWSAPSAEALALAAERMKRWEAEIDAELAQPAPPRDEDLTHDGESSSQLPNPDRVVLGAVEHAAGQTFSQPLSQPSLQPSLQPASQPLSQPGVPDTPTPVRSAFKISRPNIGSPLTSRKPFKSPLISKASGSSSSQFASPMNPNRSAASSFAKPTTFKTPLKAAFPTAEAGPSTSVSTPAKKVLGLTPRRAGNSPLKKATFVTPFKPGMKPGEPGRVQLAASQKTSCATGTASIPAITVTPGRKDKGKGRAVYFDLTPPANRETLATSGLRPQSYTHEELEGHSIDVKVLSDMEPHIAYYYRFYGRPENSVLPTSLSQSSSVEFGGAQMVLGPEEILAELKQRGCKLATQAWIDNHYGLILWKLAGMVALDPTTEADGTKRRWCWNELLRQFLYRYERELNSGVRPPIRLIASQDKPAGLPMVLCISRICSPYEYDAEAGVSVDPGPFTTTADGELIPPKPVVEVTDGWYRVRAEVDDAVVRAIRRGALRVGMKIGVVGAKLLDSRSEPFEILEAPWKSLNSDSAFALRISGNGCHLAPWHAKLGFQAQPFVATLSSLTPDGGLVPVLDVKIVKTFPIAFLEGFTTGTGKTWSHPMKELEEMKARDAWTAKRDLEAQRIRADMDKYFDAMEKCADRLEIRAGMHFHPGEYDCPPDTVDDLLYALEEACANSGHQETPKEVIGRTSQAEAGWLARAVREKLAKDRETMGDEIAQRLEDACPPRDVRSFRVVAIEDAQTRKRPKQFTAQVTIWDILTAYISEDGIPGDFRVGERFLVTNLDPNNTDAWMSRQDGAVLYLIARKDTRWRKIR